jgi:hypothetical protein
MLGWAIDVDTKSTLATSANNIHDLLLVLFGSDSIIHLLNMSVVQRTIRIALLKVFDHSLLRREASLCAAAGFR